MTQAQLAAAAGVCAQTIALLETESHSPRPATLDRISAALGVTTAELLGQEA
jgi:transcriptional regulator with XRE-family HTH domain